MNTHLRPRHRASSAATGATSPPAHVRRRVTRLVGRRSGRPGCGNGLATRVAATTWRNCGVPWRCGITRPRTCLGWLAILLRRRPRLRGSGPSAERSAEVAFALAVGEVPEGGAGRLASVLQRLARYLVHGADPAGPATAGLQAKAVEAQRLYNCVADSVAAHRLVLCDVVDVLADRASVGVARPEERDPLPLIALKLDHAWRRRHGRAARGLVLHGLPKLTPGLERAVGGGEGGPG